MKTLPEILSISTLLAVLLASFSVFTSPVIAAPVKNQDGTKNKTNVPTLEEFSASIHSSNDLPAGLYVAGKLALPIVQQPSGKPAFVSTLPNAVTQFDMASQYGTLGLLAHNTLAGAKFSGLEQGQFLTIVHGNGQIDYYRISAIERYQALSPNSPTSDFVDAAGNGARMDVTTLFNHVYGPGNRLVLQTCIAANGELSWGRMFIIAEPVTAEVSEVLEQTSFIFNSTSLGMAAK
jgi:hypothetical protein